MRRIIKTIWRIFSQNLLFGGMIICCTATVSIIPLFIPAGKNYIEILEVALPLNILVFAVLAFLTFELAAVMIDDPDTEALSAIPHVKTKTIAACVFCIGVQLLVITLLEFCSFSLRAVILGVVNHQLINHIFKATVLYGFLPGVMGITAGTAFSGDSRGRAYLLIVLFALLFSPALTNLLPEGPVGMLTRLDEWIRLFPAGIRGHVDPVYGIPLESCRFALVLFWIFFFLILRFLRREDRQKRWGRICLAAFILLLFGCGIRFHLRTKDSVFDASSAHGMLNEDSVFYEGWSLMEMPADFTVKHYEMSLRFQDRLKAETTVTITDTDQGKAEYRFTLYHGLRVDSVQDEKGNPVCFSRDGDWLDLTPKQESASFTVIYTGYIARHYSNRQGAFLPGYIAYYPMPGHLALWNSVYDCLQPVTGQQAAEFKIYLDSPTTIASNLQQTDSKTYEGFTDAPTVLGGFVGVRQDGGLTVYYPLLQYENCEIQISKLKDSYDKTADLLQAQKTLLKIDTAFVLPSFVRMNSVKEECVFFQTYFLYANIYRETQYDALARRILLASVKEGTTLQERQLLRLFSASLQEERSVEQPKGKPDYKNLEAFIRYDAGHSMDDWNALMAAQADFNTLYYYQLNRIGREVFLPQVYAYLIQDNKALQPVDFLYRLME